MPDEKEVKKVFEAIVLRHKTVKKYLIVSGKMPSKDSIGIREGDVFEIRERPEYEVIIL